ncbi:hypothetical protein HMPREF1986_01219 [Oribacterium sp. oral taxon 078 str. F0263]|nr:hypothetical protein HMPREF1986_01219 [Oribacterium sp. oral taxon 078 str. F0263]
MERRYRAAAPSPCAASFYPNDTPLSEMMCRYPNDALLSGMMCRYPE